MFQTTNQIYNCQKPSRTIQDSIDNSRMLHLSSRHQRFLRAPQIRCWTQSLQMWETCRRVRSSPPGLGKKCCFGIIPCSMIRYGTPKHAGTSMKELVGPFFWGSERWKRICPPQKIPTIGYREGGFTASATSARGRSIGDEILSLDVSMHDALGMDVRDCSLPIRQTLQILHSICPKKGWTTSEKGILFGKLFILQWIWNHYIFRHSNHPRWASCTVSIHGIRLTYLYGSMAADISVGHAKIGQFGSCKPSLLKLFHCTSMFHPQVMFFQYNLENGFSSLMTWRPEVAYSRNSCPLVDGARLRTCYTSWLHFVGEVGL